MTKRCHNCRHKATHHVVWADGRAYVAACSSGACHAAIERELLRRNGKMAEIVGVREGLPGKRPRRPTTSRGRFGR